MEAVGCRFVSSFARRVAAVLLLAAGVAAQATWTGTVNTSWNNPPNWSTAAVPTAATTVTIGVSANPPSTYTANPTCASLTVAPGAVMSLGAGFDLSIAGNLTVSGTLAVTSATSTIDVNGSVTVNSGGIFNIGSSTHTVAGNWTSSGATAFVSGTGKIQLDGKGTTVTGTHTLPRVDVTAGVRTFQATVITGDLAASGSATCSFQTGTTTTVNGDATFASGTNVAGGGTLDVDGDVLLMNATASGLLAASVIRCGGDWNEGASFVPPAGTVVLDGAASASITGSSPAHFANLTIADGTKTCNVATQIGGNFTVSFGTLGTGGLTHTVSGNWNSVAGSISGGGLVVFDASGTVDTGLSGLPGVNITGGTRTFQGAVISGSLSVSGTSTCSFQTGKTTTVNGSADFLAPNTAIAGGGTLDVDGNMVHMDANAAGLTATSVIRCGGNWTTGAAIFDPPAGSTVILDGATPTTISGVAPLNFANLTLQGGNKTCSTAMQIDGNVTLTSGNFATGGLTHTVNGDWTSTGGTTSGGGLINFTGTGMTSNGGNFMPSVNVTGGTRTFQATVISGNLIVSGTSTCSFPGGTTTTVTGTADFFASGTAITGGGTLDVDGNVLHLDANAAGLTATSVIRCGGNWFVGALVFDPPAGSTVILDGSGSTTIGGVAPLNFANLALQGGQKTCSSAMKIDGNFTLSSGFLVTGGQTHTVSGSWTSSGGQVTGGGTIVFDATGTTTTGVNSLPAVNVTGGTRTWQDATIAGNLAVSGTAACAFQSGTTTHVTGNADFIASGTAIAGGGTLDVDGNMTHMDSSAAGLTATSVIRCGGHWTTGAPVFDPPAGSTVILDGVGPTTISGVAPLNFANLTLQGTVKTCSSAMKIDGNFTLSSGLLATGGLSHTVSGNWTSSGGPVTGGGTIVFDATGTTTTGVNSLPAVNVTGGTRTWQNTTIAGNLAASAGTCTFQDGTTTTVNGDTSFASGTALNATEAAAAGPILDLNGNVSMLATVTTGLSADTEIRCAGNWTGGSTFSPTKGIVRLDGSGTTQLSGVGPGFSVAFSTLAVSNHLCIAGTALAMTVPTLVIDQFAALDSSDKHVTIASTTATVNGQLGVSAGGELSLGAGAAVTVSATGVLSVIGVPGNPATVDGASGGGYSLTVNGTLGANNFVFSGMGAAGLLLSPTCIVQAAPNDLRAGTFDRPFAAGSPLLDLQLAGTHDFRSVTFKNTLGVAGAFNARRASGSTITFTNFMGPFGGPAFEDDPGGTPGLIVWPVTTMSGFVARAGAEKATLTWSSLLEFNIDKWVVEDSAGGPFTSVGEVAPTGDGSNYAFIAAPAVPNVLHTYRLSERVNGGTVNVLATAQCTPYPATTPPNVLTVGGGGAYATIQTAINAATLPFSIVSVAPGSYAAFTIGAAAPYGLRVVGDGTGTVTIDTSSQAVTVTGLPVSSSIEIADLTIGSGISTNAGLVVNSCAGTVLIDDVVVHGGVGKAGVQILASTRTAIQRSVIDGVPGLKLDTGSKAVASLGTLDEFELAGSSTLTTCQLTSGSTVGPGSTFKSLSGLMPTLTLPSFQSLHEPYSITLQATPSHLLFIATSLQFTFAQTGNPKLEMALLADLNTGLLIPLGSVPAGGTLVLPGELPPDGSLLGVPFVVQVMTRDPVTNVSRFGHAATIIGMP